MRKLILASLLAGLCAAQNAQAFSLEFTPASQSMTVGGSQTYDLWVKGLGAELLSAYDVSVGYNSSILGLGTVTNYSGLNGGVVSGSDFTQDRTVAGTLGLVEFSSLLDAELLAAQGLLGDFKLFSATFIGLAAGTSDITLTSNLIVGLTNDQNPTQNPVSIEITPDSILNATAIVRGGEQNNVPEPSALALLGLGLLGIMVSRRSKM